MKLREISKSDIDCLENSEYNNLSLEKRQELIADSQKGVCRGKFFKFYVVEDNGECVGFINMYAHSLSVISIAPEIKLDCRRKGKGTQAVLLALEKAKEFGYKIALASIKEQNIASCKLQEKLGFEYMHTYISKNGNTLRLYLKSL